MSEFIAAMLQIDARLHPGERRTSVRWPIEASPIDE
jgi:hypothetical protein